MRYLWLCFLLWGIGVQAQTPDSTLFTDEIYSTGWVHPTGMAFDDNGQMYVWERFGRFYVSPDGKKPSSPTLDLRAEVGSWNDHGLLNVLLHPDFLNNGYIYLFYAVERHYLLYYGTPDYDPNIELPQQATIGRLTRYTLDVNDNFQSVVPNSRKVILGKTIDDGFPLMHKSHGLGGIAFGTDGTLLVSCGDGAAYDGADNGDDAYGSFALQGLADGILKPHENVGAFRAQLIDSHNGKILRIDPETGAGLPSNPFYDASAPQSPRSRVWALGMRNPYRFSVQPGTGSTNPADGSPGTLFVADVGWKRWEEINVVDAPGLNFGWPLYEGMWEEPIYQNATTEHPQAPNPLSGNTCQQDYYYFQDLLRQPTNAVVPSFPHPCDPSRQIGSDMPRFVHRWPALAWPNFTASKQGIVSYPDEAADGTPIAMPIDDPASQVSGQSFLANCIIGGFFYEGSLLPELFQGAYMTANYGGGLRFITLNEENNIDGIYLLPGGFKDMHHMAYNPADECIYYMSYNNFRIYRICYGGNPPPRAILETDLQYGPSPLTIQFDASASEDPQGEPLSFFWEFGDGSTDTTVSPQHTFIVADGQPQSFWTRLSVRDSAGNVRTDSVLISVNNTPPQVAITSFPDSFFYTLSGITTLPLRAEVTDTEHGLEALQYVWKAFLHHNTHFHAEPPDSLPESWAAISPEGCNEETYYYRIRLEVTDGAGLVGTDEHLIFPYCGDPLVVWDTLMANPFQDRVSLEWSSSFEEPGTQYVVERSADPVNFRPFSESIGTGNPSYLYDDMNPLQGKNYYRIAVIRADGYTEYSPVSLALYPPPPAFEVYPNPVSSLLEIKMHRIYGQGRLQLIDLSGKVVYTHLWEGDRVNFEDQLSIGHLPPALYFYQLDNGKEIENGKLLKLD